MCTGITYSTQDHYFGRNLDLELSYGQKVVVTPRNFTFPFRKIDDMTSHYAMIGMSAVVDDYPLYFDASNEKGLSMAGLAFTGNAYYSQKTLTRSMYLHLSSSLMFWGNAQALMK